MAKDFPHPILKGKKALVAGIASEHSIAWGCAKAFHELGADLAITYLSDIAKAYVAPLAESLGAPIFMPLDVSKPGELEAVFARIQQVWGRLDIMVHSIAFAPRQDLQGRLLDCSATSFAIAMDISCHSFIRMAKLAVPLMKVGGCMFAMSYHGAQKVVSNYNVMGPPKAALEAACRYLAYELGPRKIRVHAISPGPLKTRAASGLKDLDLLLNEAGAWAPVWKLVDIMDVGFTCAFLATPYAGRITGETIYVDGGVNTMALEAQRPVYEATKCVPVDWQGSSGFKRQPVTGTVVMSYCVSCRKTIGYSRDAKMLDIAEGAHICRPSPHLSLRK